MFYHKIMTVSFWEDSTWQTLQVSANPSKTISLVTTALLELVEEGKWLFYYLSFQERMYGKLIGQTLGRLHAMLTDIPPTNYTRQDLLREKSQLLYEPRCEKTGLRGLRPGLTQTRLYNHRG